MAYISRRSFMQGTAGLFVAFSMPRAAAASATTVAADSVDAYLAVAPDGGVMVFSGKVDLGTGARAAIRQIVAEELSLSPERIGLIEGDTAITPDQGPTGGSTGIMVGGVQIRQAAATARARLLALGAAHLNRPQSSPWSPPSPPGLMMAEGCSQGCCRSMPTHLTQSPTCALRSGGKLRRRCAHPICAHRARLGMSSRSRASLTNSRPLPALIRSPIGSVCCTILAAERSWSASAQ
jgi:Molybdopterin-binding domain of aldehyde dehydrogenase